MAGTINTVSRLELQGFAEAKRKITDLVKAKKAFEAAPKRGMKLLPASAEEQLKRILAFKKDLERPWKVAGIQGLDKLKTQPKLKFETTGVRKVADDIRGLLKLKKDWEKPAKNPFRNVTVPRPKPPKVPDTTKLTIFQKVMNDLSDNTLARFSNRVNLSTSTLGSMASAVGISSGTLTTFAAVAGPVVVILGGLAAGAAATAAGYTFAASKAIDYQVATQGVAKTTDLVGKAFEDTRQQLIDMSTDPQLGQTAKELAGITEVAGTLGIRGTANLTIFTEAMARLKATSDIVGQEGTQQVGKFLAVTGRQASETLSLASALSGLAANYATTEAAALSTGLEVAKGGVSFNLAAEDALAMGAVYDAYGIQAEIARSATLRLGQTIQSAVISGGKDLQKLADIAGISAQELSDTFKDDAGEGIEALLRGFKRLSDQKQDVSKVLDDIGLSGVRLGAIIPTLAKNVDDLDRAMALASDESRNPSRIFMESANMADTTARRYATLQNEVTALAIRVGDELLPALDLMILTSSDILAVISSMEGSFGAFGSGILAAIAQKFRILAGEIQLASDVWQHGLLDAVLGGAGEIERVGNQIADFHAEIEELNKVAASGDLKAMQEAYVGVQSTIGKAEAQAKRYKQKLDELWVSTKKGTEVTEEQKGQIEALRTAHDKAKAQAETYRRATTKLKDEIDFLTKIEHAAATEVSLVVAARETQRQKQEEVTKETQKYRSELEKLGKSITEKFLTPTQKAEKEIAKLDELLAKDLITFETWELAVKDARKELEQLTPEVKAFNSAVEAVAIIRQTTEAVREFGVDANTAAAAVKLAADANIELAAALDLIQQKQQAQAQLDFESGGGFFAISDEDIARMTAGMDLWELGKTRIDHYRNELKKLKKDLDNKDITQQQFDNAKASLDGQMEGWEILGAKIAEVAEKSGGIWQKMLGGLSENLGEITDALGRAAEISFQSGNETAGHILNAAQAGMSGDYTGMAMSAVAATGFGQQKISQFGGRGEGNFVQEGMQIGSAFGPWGTLIGGVVGAFVKKGADDFHSHMTEVAGQANLVITQAEGDLDKVGEQIKGTVDGMLNQIQSMVGADLDFALKGFEIHIREDRIRVVANGVEQIFKDMNQAIDFFIHGMIDAQGELAGLGPNMQAAFSQISSTTTATGDPERLMQALSLASQMDFEETGVRQDLINIRRQEMELIRDFGIPMENYLAFKNRELETYKRSLLAQASGIQDWAGNIAALSKEMSSVNNTVEAQRAVDMARKVELEGLLAAQQASTAAIAEGNAALNQNTQSLQQNTGMTDAQAQAHQNGSQAAHSYIQGTQGVTSTYTGGLHPMEQYGRALTEEGMARRDGIFSAREYQAELDLINASLENIPGAFDPEEMQRVIDAQVAGAAAQIGNMILGFAERGLIDLSADERITLRQQLFELEKVAAITQLYATQAQIQAMLALGTISANVAGILQSFLDNVPKYLNQIANATFDPGKIGGGGGNRRQQRKEEERRLQEEADRAAAEAAEKVEAFNASLRTLQLNASSASGTLGQLADRIAQINKEAQEALEAGADPEAVKERQSLQFRELRREVLDPFTSFGRDEYGDQSEDIERMRRDAIDKARMIAEEQAAALGVPMQAIFNNMEEEINKGAARMQRALTQSLIDSFNLPLETTRSEMRDFSKQMKDLDDAYKKGNISQRRYKELLKQIRDAQTQALQSDLLGMLDKYYGEIEGKEELRKQLEIASFNIQLAMLQMRLNTLIAEGAITRANAAQVQGFLDYMNANPPDWEAWFNPEQETSTIGGSSISSGFSGGGRGTTAGTDINLDSLIAAINNFVNGFNAIDMGQFERMAHEYLTTIEGFKSDLENELDTVLSTGYELGAHAVKTARNFLRQATGDYTLQLNSLDQLTTEQLEMLANADLSGIDGFRQGVDDVFDVLLAIEQAEALKPQAIQNILKAYKKLPEETSQLAGEFRNIHSEFADVITALESLGASEEELFEARKEHARQLLEFEQKALADIRSVGEDIREGQVFGNVTARQRVGIAEQRLAELRSRIAADPADFEAIEALGPAMREVLNARRELTGGVGPEFTLALERIRQLSENFELNLGETATTEEQTLTVAENQLTAAETHLTLTREQTAAFQAGMQTTTLAMQDNALAISGGFAATNSIYTMKTDQMMGMFSSRLDTTRAATVELGNLLLPAITDAKNAARMDMEYNRAQTERHIGLTARTNYLLEKLTQDLLDMLESAIANRPAGYAAI